MHRTCLAGFVLVLLAITPLSAQSGFPENPRDLRAPIPIEVMGRFLEEVERPGLIEVTREGTSTQSRPLYLVHLRRSEDASFRVLLYAQQHGDEPAGKDAALYFIRRIARDPSTLPADVDLWILPSLNPDGAVAGTRVNGAGKDLNRDHMLLNQPETRMLHQLVRRLRPHLTADCHEFARDNEDFVKKGWLRWPVITMDALNNPLFPPGLTEEGLRRVREVEPAMSAAGLRYARYMVGGPPPELEIRPSATDVDDGRNGLGGHGCLSFIIESGKCWRAADPQADLPDRVEAYLALFQQLLGARETRARIEKTVLAARQEPMPQFLPTNYFWANLGAKSSPARVIRIDSGKLETVDTPNLVTDLVVKHSIPMPVAYAVEDRFAEAFRQLLERHGIAYETLAPGTILKAERCRLARLEEEYDLLYDRFEGRQIVERQPAAEHRLDGGLLIRLTGEDARRTALLLDPAQLYGLYRYPEFRGLVDPEGFMPVLRVLAAP